MRLFASKICGNLPPSLGIPLVNRGSPRVVVKPHFRFSYHVEQVLIGCVPLNLRLASFLTYPRKGGNAVRINNPIEVVFFYIRQPEHKSEKLADVVSALLERSAVEYFRACISNNSTEFHYSGVAAAGCIYRQGR